MVKTEAATSCSPPRFKEQYAKDRSEHARASMHMLVVPPLHGHLSCIRSCLKAEHIIPSSAHKQCGLVNCTYL